MSLRVSPIMIAAAAVATAGAADAAVTVTGLYSQNFDTLATTGTANTTLPDGWSINEAGSSARAHNDYAAGTGSDNTGDVYSFGAAGSTERALGTLRSASGFTAMSFDFTFINGYATAINQLGVAYTGETWRVGATGRNDRLAFSYAVDGESFTAIPTLDYTTTLADSVGAKNGNSPSYSTRVIYSLTNLSIASGSTVVFRWSDINTASGAQDGLAVDDFSVNAVADAAAAVPEPASWAMMVAGFGLLGATMRRRKQAAAFA